MGSEWFRARAVEAKVLHSLSRGLTSWYRSLPFPDARKLFEGTLTISWLAGKEVLKWGGMGLGVGAGLTQVRLVFTVQHFGLAWFLAAVVGLVLVTGLCFSPESLPGPRNSGHQHLGEPEDKTSQY